MNIILAAALIVEIWIPTEPQLPACTPHLSSVFAYVTKRHRVFICNGHVWKETKILTAELETDEDLHGM